MPRPQHTSFEGDIPCGALVERKFGMKPNMTAIVIGAPETLAAEIDGEPVPSVADIPDLGVFDFVHLFVRGAEGLDDLLMRASARLSKEGFLWVSFPKWSSPMFEGLTVDGVRETALPLGLVDMKTKDVDDDWCAIKLVPRHIG